MITFPAKPKVVRKFVFYSKSQPGVKYFTELWNNGRITCDCPSYKKCWHIKRIEKHLKVEKYKNYV